MEKWLRLAPNAWHAPDLMSLPTTDEAEHKILELRWTYVFDDCHCNTVSFTQNSQNGVILQNLHRSWADEVYRLESVALADEELSWRTKGGLDDERQGPETPPAGWLKQRQLQQLFIQVHGYVSSQLVREVLQQLERNPGENRHYMSYTQVFTLLSLSALFSDHYCVGGGE